MGVLCGVGLHFYKIIIYWVFFYKGKGIMNWLRDLLSCEILRTADGYVAKKSKLVIYISDRFSIISIAFVPNLISGDLHYQILIFNIIQTFNLSEYNPNVVLNKSLL